MEKLELKHVAPYLPYGLKGINEIRKVEVNIIGLQTDLDVIHNHGKTPIRFIKPILRPLSYLFELFDSGHYEQWQEEWINHLFDFETKIHEVNIYAMPYDLMECCFQNHIDVHGLIEKGLAVDFNTI